MNYTPFGNFAFDVESISFVILAFAMFAYVFGWFPSPKYKRMLIAWCEQNNYKIKTIKKRYTVSPFSWIIRSNGFSYFEFEVLDEDGNIKKGYAQCGNFLFGSHINEVKVIWKK